ncbi:MAG: AAA family ATPase [Chloroflexi bacterium]|nr:AAA family ATPase [Chloroflexota bacterium]
MKFQRVHLDGFGRLLNVEFSFAPGLNVFFGPNEAGKSTLQQSIFALLYGYFSGSRKNAREAEPLERYRPWQGGVYGGQLSYKLDSGRSFTVTRTFDDELHTDIRDAETGHDLSDQFERGRLGRLDFAAQHFAMPQNVFINTCFVRQAELQQLAGAADLITETIVNLADTGSKDHSVIRAQEILETTFREKVGSDRARTKPLPSARLRLAELQTERESVMAQRRLLEDDYETHGRLKTGVQSAEFERDRLAYLLGAVRLSDLRARAGRVEQSLADEADLSQQIAELNASGSFPLEKRESVTRLSQDWRRAMQAAARQEQSIAQQLPQVAQQQAVTAQLREQVLALEAARNIPVEQEQPLRDLERLWRAAVEAARQADDNLSGKRRAVEAALPVRAEASKRAALLDAGPDKVHDLRLNWEAANRRVTEVQTEAAQAEAAWTAQQVTDEIYASLRNRVAAVDAAQIAELKRLRASTTRKDPPPAATPELAKPVSGNLPLPLMVASLLGVGGLALAGVGLLLGLTLLLLAGVAMVVGALVVVAVSLRSPPQMPIQSATLHPIGMPPATISPAAEQLDARLAALGFSTLDEIEDSTMRFMQLRPLHDAWVAATIKAEKARRERDVLESELARLLAAPAAAPVTAEQCMTLEREARELAQRLRNLDDGEQQASRAEQDAGVRRGELQQIEERVRRLLTTAGIAGPDLGTDVRAFYALCEQRRKLEQTESRIREIEAKLEASRSANTDLQHSQLDAAAAEKGLRQIFVQAGIKAADLEAGLAEFEHRSEQVETASRLQQQLQSRKSERAAALQLQSPEQLKEQLVAAKQAADVLVATHPEFAAMQPSESAQALEAKADANQRQLMKLAAELATVEARLASNALQQRSLPEIDEEILALNETIGRLTFHAEALQLALKHLAAAADEHHRNFLPRLNQIVGRSLATVTGGRYHTVQIDHADLQVRVQAPETNQPVTSDQLSRGAQEQIYLLLRLGLTELMSDGRERLPLILDDPLVNYDHERLLHALDFLARLAEQTQILLFTKDEVIVDWFARTYANTEAHKLHRLDMMATTIHP